MQSSPLVWWEAKQTQRTEAPCLNHPRTVHREATRTHTSRLTASLVPCPRQHGPLDGGPLAALLGKAQEKAFGGQCGPGHRGNCPPAWGATFRALPWPPSQSAWPAAWSRLCCQPGFCGGPVQRWRRGQLGQQLWALAEWPVEEHLPGGLGSALQGPEPGSGLLLTPALWLSLRQAVLFLRPPPTPPCAGRPPDSAQERI